MLTKDKIEERHRYYQDYLLNDIIPFWVKHSIDRECGGYLTLLDRDGSAVSTDKPVWIQGREAWLFSWLYNNLERRQEWIDIAGHGIEFLMKHCFDTDGRMFYLVTRDGKPLRKRRYLFTETFGIISCAEYAKATGDKQSLKRAKDTYRLMVKLHRTPGSLPPKIFPGTRQTKSHAMPMILLATTQTLRQLSDDPLYKEVVDNSLDEILNQFIKPDEKALFETVGLNGERLDSPEGRCINPGHAIESAWFMMHEARYRNDSDLVNSALKILDWSLELGWDKEYGGIFSFVDIEGKPPLQLEWDMKLWWPHAEAIYASLLAYHLTGEEKYLDWHEKIHEWAFNHFADKERGEWFAYLHRDGSLSLTLKGSFWKGPFHVPRMLVLCMKLLEEISKAR